jgi:hypothetical protein
MESVSPKVRVGVQGLGRATETARSWSALKGIRRVSFQFDTSTEEPDTGLGDENTTATALGDGATYISLNTSQELLNHQACYAHQKG